jgi:hypothetical protein
MHLCLSLLLSLYLYLYLYLAVLMIPGVPSIDLFWSMQAAESNWSKTFLNDGLHLSAQGNKFLLQKLLDVIQANFADIAVDALPFQVPLWSNVGKAYAASSLSGSQQCVED